MLAGKKSLDNFLVLKHEIVPKDKQSELTKLFGENLEKLPKILKSDPLAEEIDAQRGDVLRIIRKSPTAGKSYYYRIVI